MSQWTREVQPAERRPRRRVPFYLGLVLLAAGVAVLGYVAWEYFGTNVVSHHRQQQLVTQTQRAWHSEAGATAAGSGSTATAPAVPHAAQALLRIPRFGKGYVMPVQEGVSDDVLAEGFGHFEGSAQAGQRGNYALAAHRVTHGEPLREMPELRPGDRVLVQTRTHLYTYVLDTDPNRLVVSFRDVWVIGPAPHNPVAAGVQPDLAASHRLITLTTCSELFHTDNRMIVFGHLVRSRAT